MTLRVEALDLDAATGLRAAWDDLAARCLEPSIFGEADFVLSAARHLPGRKPAVLVAWDDAAGGRLAGICPVAPGCPVLPALVWTHPQAVAAFPLLDRDAPEAILSAIVDAAGRLRGAPALLLQGLDLDGPTARLAGRLGDPVLLDQRTRAVLRPGAGHPGLGAKARKELRRQWNRLAERGPLTFSVASAPEDVVRALERFLTLEAKGWKGSRGTALGSRPGPRAFVRSAVTGLAARGLVAVAALEVAGAPAAMGVVLRSGDRAFFWKTAFDEQLARFSPGLQLTLKLTDWLEREPGLSLVDSCAIPGHSMIDRLWADRITVADILLRTGSHQPRFAWSVAAEKVRRDLRTRAKTARQILARG